MIAAESQYRRVKGFRQLDRLSAAISVELQRQAVLPGASCHTHHLL